MKSNLGKKFEQNFQTYAKKDGIFCLRIQDSDLSFCGGNSKFTKPSICDFIMFYNSHLFAIECKSTKYKSFSIDLGQDSNGSKMIHAHQIQNLIDVNQYENAHGVFVFNFRNELNDSILTERTYLMDVRDFSNFVEISKKYSINEQDIIDFGGVLCSQQRKRKFFTYEVKELLESYLQREEEKINGEKNI